MMSRRVFWPGAMLLALTACSGRLEAPASPERATIDSVIFRLPVIPFEEDAATRVEFVRAGTGFTFSWQPTDTIGIYPDAGSQVYFVADEAVSGSSASFDGGGWGLKTTSSYYSYLPFIGDIYLNRKRVPVSFEGQVQRSLSDPVPDIRAFFASKGELSDGKLSFNYSVLNCYINVNATLPAGTYTRMDVRLEDPLFVAKGVVDITADAPAIVGTEFTSTLSLALENVTLEEEGVVAAYLACAPVAIGGKTVRIDFTDATGIVWRCTKTPSKDYEANHRYGLTCTGFQSMDGYSFGIEGWRADAGYTGLAE